jgi:hypothetical protein
MDFFDVVFTQRSIRQFKPDPVPDDALWQILDAAIRAPSGSNEQDTRYEGYWNDPDPSHRPGSNPTKSATQAEATRAAHHFGVSSNVNVTIVVAQPYGGTCSAYHDWDGDVGVAFLNLPYNSDPGCAGGAKTLSHELAETMTDPHPEYPFYGWTNPEVADPCNNTAGQVGMPNGSSFYVQGIWSNAANRCVLTS